MMMNEFSYDIKSPALVIDKEKCISNISSMTSKAKSSNVEFRPHFKTHQSGTVGNWFKDFGIRKITVSSVTMAYEFAEAGWTDILIAFTLNKREIIEINDLATRIRLHVLVESLETAKFLSKNITTAAGVYVKIDAGYHRTGILYENVKEVEELVDFIENDAMLEFQGLLSHFGNTYQARSKQEVVQVYQSSLANLKHLTAQLQRQVKISIGDTPSCSVLDTFHGIDEIRPGNFVFYDLMQWQIGACSLDEIAVTVACPVVAKHQGRKEIVLYGGAVHLSKEALVTENGKPVYGLLTEWWGNRWNGKNSGDFIVRISQEHGILRTESNFNKLQTGDLAFIYPVHSCLSADLLKNNQRILV